MAFFEYIQVFSTIIHAADQFVIDVVQMYTASMETLSRFYNEPRVDDPSMRPLRKRLGYESQFLKYPQALSSSSKVAGTEHLPEFHTKITSIYLALWNVFPFGDLPQSPGDAKSNQIAESLW